MVTDIDPKTILDTVRSLGVRPGDVLLCHSSYKSFGSPVAGGPDAVARTLVDLVSPGGCVFLPTFNFGHLTWDVRTTPSVTGVITERFRQLSGVLRSLHPTHAVAGCGPLAAGVLASHEHTHPFGEGSPIWRLWKLDAWVLLLGVDHSSSSTVHVAEEANRLPYLRRTRVQRVLAPDGTWRDVTLRRPGCSNGFVKIDPALRAASAIREARIGRSRLMLMRSADILRAATDMLSRDKAALLCDAPDCERCAEARQMIAAASD